MTKTRMEGRVVMVTGANGSMGRVIATDLAGQGATVVLVVRRHDQGEALRREIITATGNTHVDFIVADLSDQSAIHRLAEEFCSRHDRLHVLVNNAGAHFRERQLSKDGVEMHLAVNHLSWFLLTHLLLDLLKASAPARIVNVASQAIADTRPLTFLGNPKPATLTIENLQSEHDYEPMLAYARSKLALVMCGYALAHKLQGTEVTVNALHPGLVATDIVNDVAPSIAKPLLGVIRRFLLSPEQGASNAIHLASDLQVKGVTGKYFIQQRASCSPQISYDVLLQEQLWRASSALVGLKSGMAKGENFDQSLEEAQA